MHWLSLKRVAQFLVCVVFCLPSTSICVARQTSSVQSSVESAPLTVDAVVGRMEARNRERAAALRKYEGTRIYRMQYRGFFGSHDAEMIVSVKASPQGKQFTVESQSGSKFIIDHVFKKLLDGESEATTEEARQRTALDSRNYDFTLVDVDKSSGDPEYVLNVTPRTGEKYLYRGKIWVDSKDFAVARIEAEPAKNPSMWIKKTAINHKYEKLNDFWLPAENRTDSWIRLGGHALLSIEYREYRITEATPLNVSASVPYEREPTSGR
jgi:hypothetical protein